MQLEVVLQGTRFQPWKRQARAAGGIRGDEAAGIFPSAIHLDFCTPGERSFPWGSLMVEDGDEHR